MESRLVSVLLCGYLGFLTVLLLWIAREGFATHGWSDEATSNHSIVIAMAAMSGWFDKVFATLNFLFGLSGGYLAEKQAGNDPKALRRPIMLVLTVIIAALALIDLTWVAYHFDDIGNKLPPFQVGTLKVADAIAAIGVIHLGLVGGVIAGIGLKAARS